MIRFYGLSEHSVNKAHEFNTYFPNIPVSIIDKLILQFTETQILNDSTKIKISQRMKDKLLGYILCLCLILNDFSLDPTQIAVDLSLKVSKITAMLRELGCRIDNKKSETSGEVIKVAKLSLPLTFPQRRK